MPKSIKVGIVTHAQGAHLGAYFSALKNIPEAAQVALADPSGKIVAQAKAALGEKLTNVYDNVPAMLKKFKPKMALVSMEAALAPPAIDAALEAGCHVLAEKPSCVKAEDFAPLARKAESKHQHLMLALANRIHAAVEKARQIVRHGALGKLYGVEMHLVADQTRLTRKSYRDSWFCKKERGGGGHLIWLGIHWLDLALYITGEKIQQVAGFTSVVGGQPIDVEDSAAVSMRFSGGALGTLTSGYYLDKGYHSHIKIWGEHGWLRLHAVEEEPLQWYSSKDGPASKVQQFEYPKGKRGYEPFVRQCVRASADLQEPPVTPAECLHVLEAIFAFYKAAETGKTQTIR